MSRRSERKVHYLKILFGRVKKFILVIALVALFLVLVVARKRPATDFREVPIPQFSVTDQKDSSPKEIKLDSEHTDLHKPNDKVSESSKYSHPQNVKYHEQIQGELFKKVEAHLSKVHGVKLNEKLESRVSNKEKSKDTVITNHNDMEKNDKGVSMLKNTLNPEESQRNKFKSHENIYENIAGPISEASTTTMRDLASLENTTAYITTTILPTESTTIYTADTTTSDIINTQVKADDLKKENLNNQQRDADNHEGASLPQLKSSQKQEAASNNQQTESGPQRASSDAQKIDDTQHKSSDDGTLPVKSISAKLTDSPAVQAGRKLPDKSSIKTHGPERSVKISEDIIRGHKTINLDTSKEDEQRIRKKVIHDFCKTRDYQPLSIKDAKLLHSEKYNLYSRAVPKIGSTFLKQMFAILNKGANKANKEFNLSRELVHKTLGAQRLNTRLDNASVIVPVRNPYSRLFAAYVDKIYLPNSRGLIKAVVKYTKHHNTFSKETFLSKVLGQSNFSNPKCAEHMVSFQNFLTYALNFKHSGKMANHYDSCFLRLQKTICSTDSYILVKQESFADDMQYILRKVNVNKIDPESYDVIFKSLKETRAQVTVPGIIDATFHKFDKGDRVWKRRLISERLWHSFQIQGYINIKSPFPGELFSSKPEIKISFVKQVILNEIETNPVMPDERKRQRNEAMLEAYRQVDDKLMTKIREVYGDDFSAFQYNKEL